MVGVGTAGRGQAAAGAGAAIVGPGPAAVRTRLTRTQPEGSSGEIDWMAKPRRFRLSRLASIGWLRRSGRQRAEDQRPLNRVSGWASTRRR